ncbi:MAG: hypothetical protein WBE13_18000 [Candidatus Acidiferrum sp.]
MIAEKSPVCEIQMLPKYGFSSAKKESGAKRATELHSMQWWRNIQEKRLFHSLPGLN